MRKTIRDNLTGLVLIVCFALFCILYFPHVTLENTGDGAEYILQVISVQKHLSFGVTEQDVLLAKKEFYNEADILEHTFSNDLHAYSDKFYCNHFGVYSLLVLPIKLLVQLFGLYPLWAFPITNLILWTAALLVIVFGLKTTQRNKICILLLSMINPAFFYLTWIHTEIYIFSFVIIGLVFFYNRQYGRSILFFSVAAMQNIAVLPFAMMVGLDYILNRIVLYKKESDKNGLREFVKKDGIRIVSYGFFYVPALLPLVLTYIRFGTFSLVAEAAMESKYLLHKAVDYLFDLNIGIFPYEPIVLIFFVVLAVLGIKKCTRVALVNLFGVFGILFVISNQLQINSGMHIIMRYNVWIIPIMCFYVMMWQGGVWDKAYTRKNIVVIFELFFTTAMIFYTNTSNGKFSSIEFAPWTEVVMDKTPQLYNPSHGIFYSRELGTETYYSSKPVAYENEEGYVRKVLLSEEAEELFYSDEYVIVDETGKQIDKLLLDTVTIDQGDYKYVNIKDNYYMAYAYELGTEIWFYTEEYNADDYVVQGLSVKEEWGSWTEGNKTIMLFYIEDIDTDFLNITLELDGVFCEKQNVTILANNDVVYEHVLEGEQEINFIVQNPETGFLKLEIELPDAVAPSEVVEGSADSRVLGVGLKKMSIDEADYNYSISETTTNCNIWFYSDEYNADTYILKGLSEPEEFFSWTDGHEMLMCIILDEMPENPLNIYIDVFDTYYQPQDVSILINGEVVYENTIEGDQDIEFSVEGLDTNLLEVSILLPNAVSPSEVENYNDERVLGLALKQMRIS